MPSNNNRSSYAGAGYLFMCGQGAQLTADTEIDLTDGVHVVDGSAAIDTIAGGSASNSNLAFLIKDAAATWSLAAGGNITGSPLPFTPSPDSIVPLVWDQTYWRVASLDPIVVRAGSADDIQTMLNMLNALGGGTLELLPHTTYTLTTPLNWTSFANVTMRGHGYSTVISATVADAVIVGTSSQKCTIRDLRITGTFSKGVYWTSASQGEIRNCDIGGATLNVAPLAAGIFLDDCSGTRLIGNRLAGNGFGPSQTVTSLDIYLRGQCSRCLVDRNYCTSTAVTMHIGIETDGVSQVTENNIVCRNYCNGAIARSDGFAWGYGIYVYTSGSYPQRTQIFGNIVQNTEGNGIYINAKNVVVAHNEVFDVCQVTVPGQLAIGGIAANSTATNVIIANNYIGTCPQVSIYCDAPGSVITGNVIEGGTSQGIYGGPISSTIGTITISDNTISGKTGADAHGIHFDTATTLVMGKNIIKGMGGHGIFLDTVDHATLSGNVITDNSVSTANTFDGVHLVSCTDVAVDSNQCFNSGGTGMRYGVDIDAGCVRTHVTNNILRSCQTDGIRQNGTSTFRSGNQYSTGALRARVALVAGTVTVTTAEIRTGDNIQVDRQIAGGTCGHLSVANIVNATSYDIVSTDALDTSTVLGSILH